MRIASSLSRAVRPRRRGNQGSILMVSVILMVVAGVSVLAWLGFLVESQRAAIRDRDRTHAFYAADAGIEQLVDYFNNPDNFTGSLPDDYVEQALHPTNYVLPHPDIIPTSYGLFEPYIVEYEIDDLGLPVYRNGELAVTRSTFFRDLSAGSANAISQTSKLPSGVLDLSGNERLIMLDENGVETARVTQIELVHPSELVTDGTLPANLRVITKVIATGRTPSGVESRVESLITENPAFNIRSSAAIITLQTVSFNGNYNVHWGEVWAQADVNLPSNFEQKIPRHDPLQPYSPGQNNKKDFWFRLRTEGLVKNHNGNQFADGRERHGFASEATPPGPLYESPFETLFLHPQSRLDGLHNIKQRQTLNFPIYDYYDWKTFVQTYGFRYYFTDTSGNIYGLETNSASPQFGQIVSKSYEDWFDIEPDDPNYLNVEDMIVFVDSVPVDDNGNTGPSVGGVPVINSTYYPRGPDDPAYRKSTIRISGGGIHTRGAMFFAADIAMTGQGNPPSWQDVPGVLMPTGEPPPSSDKWKVSHNGFFYSYGTIEGAGNRTVYGSIYAVEGYGSSGDPQVYYNYRMRDGSWLNLNVSRVNRVYWNIVPAEG